VNARSFEPGGAGQGSAEEGGAHAQRAGAEAGNDGASELQRLQRWVVEHLQSRRGLPQSEAVSREARGRLTGNDRLSPVEQLEIYREQFWLRHTASLVEDFPGIGGILDLLDSLLFNAPLMYLYLRHVLSKSGVAVL